MGAGVSGLVSGIIGGVITAAIIGWVRGRKRDVVPDADGRMSIRPGAFVYLVNAIGIALSGVMIFVIFVVNSNGELSQKDMIAVIFMLLFSSIMTTLNIFWMFYQRLSWNGLEIQIWNIRNGSERRFFSDIESFRLRRVLGVFEFAFRDGHRLWVSDLYLGANQFLAEAEKAIAASRQARSTPSGVPRIAR